MSNLREIDGIFVNLDRVDFIGASKDDKEKGKWVLSFFMNTAIAKLIYGDTKYKTEKEAKERIREIIKQQSKETK